MITMNPNEQIRWDEYGHGLEEENIQQEMQARLAEGSYSYFMRKFKETASEVFQEAVRIPQYTKRGLLWRSLDVVGYIPVVALGAGSVRVICGIALAILAGFGYVAGYLLKNKAIQNKAIFFANRALDEIRRARAQEIFTAALPCASLYADTHYPSVDERIGRTARGSVIVINSSSKLTYYTTQQFESRDQHEIQDFDL
jgi:hypothetical protein